MIIITNVHNRLVCLDFSEKVILIRNNLVITQTIMRNRMEGIFSLFKTSKCREFTLMVLVTIMIFNKLGLIEGQVLLNFQCNQL